MSYNLSQVRILWEIASDGLYSTTSNIKSSSGLQVAGDFEVTNVKSDVVEQVWRSHLDANGAAWFILDAGSPTSSKAIMPDTIAILNHNLSSTAEISVIGYGEANSFVVPTVDQILLSGLKVIDRASPNVDYPDFLWVMPVASYPTLINQKKRYWLIYVKDPANGNTVNVSGVDKNYIQIGRFIAGEATIFTPDENLTSDITYQEVSYKDEVKINGYTSISNSRSLKKKLRCEFKNLNALAAETTETPPSPARVYHNLKNLHRFIRYCRDTLKSLVIVDSRDPYLFYAYGKLSETPSEKCNYLDDRALYVSMDLEWDEAK